jgi:hypothetical protein
MAGFFGYAGYLVLIGLLGTLVPRLATMSFEVYAGVLFRVPLEPRTLASALNQYRFMKFLEVMLGVFAIVCQREIFTIPKANQLFLWIIAGGAGVRLLSLAVDGRPDDAYLVFAGFELAIGSLVWAHSRRTLMAVTAPPNSPRNPVAPPPRGERA